MDCRPVTSDIARSSAWMRTARSPPRNTHAHVEPWNYVPKAASSNSRPGMGPGTTPDSGPIRVKSKRLRIAVGYRDALQSFAPDVGRFSTARPTSLFLSDSFSRGAAYG